MRVPLKGDDSFSIQVNSAFAKVQQAFVEAVRPRIAMKKTNAMLGDGTITEVSTFDPESLGRLMNSLAGLLEGWTAEVSRSNTDDLHRIYCKAGRQIVSGRRYHYYIIGYFGVQFHALPYYKVDKRVIEIQKELVGLSQQAVELSKNISGAVDKVLQDELAKIGLAHTGVEDLFTKLLGDEKLADELDRKAGVVESQFPEFEQMKKRKEILLEELNGLVVYHYQTSDVLIDHNRLMQGEEGIVSYFDIEVVKVRLDGSGKNKGDEKREAYIDTKKVPADAANQIAGLLWSIAEILAKLQYDM